MQRKKIEFASIIFFIASLQLSGAFSAQANKRILISWLFGEKKQLKRVLGQIGRKQEGTTLGAKKNLSN